MMMKNKQKIQGLTLIEVLITILVIAIGMLGMAALQMKTLTSTQESYARSQAVAWLSDASSRIMANREFFADDPGSYYTGEKASGDINQWCEVGATPYEEKNTCNSGSCSGEQLAQADIDAICMSMSSSGIQGAQAGITCNDRDPGDGDACSAGSKLTLYAAWPQIERADSGDQLVTTARCQEVLPPGTDLDLGYSCAIVEIIP